MRPYNADVDFLFHNIGPLYYHCVNQTLPINISAHVFLGRFYLRKYTVDIKIYITVNVRNISLQFTHFCHLGPKRNTIKLEDINFKKTPRVILMMSNRGSQLLPSNVKMSNHMAW